jgi:hypothetical protein
VRAQGVNTDALHVPWEPLAFNATIVEHFEALVPDIDDFAVTDLLNEVGLGYLASDPAGLMRASVPRGGSQRAHSRSCRQHGSNDFRDCNFHAHGDP